ncbi:MAG: SGNH/GDSL hydrolase family protein [Deltaproteobacteria bacterium]
MKGVFRIVRSVLIWAVVVLIGVEVLSFVAITVSNLVLYGRAREGSGAVYDPYSLFLMAEGVRPTTNNSVSYDVDKNRIIWLFGGSTMRGSTDSPDKTIASFLAAFLNSRQRDLDFTVINYGMKSFNSLLEVQYLQKLLIESQEPPDLIVFYDGANDVKYLVEHQTPYGHYGYRRAKALIESYDRSWFGLLKPLNAAIYSSFTKELFDKIHQVFVPIKHDSKLVREMARTVEERYDHAEKMARAYGAEFLVVWQPMRWVERCGISEEVKSKEKGLPLSPQDFTALQNNFSIPYMAIAERLKKKPYFVDFQNIFCGRKVPMYKPDGVHLLDEGRESVARQMGRIIVKRFFSGTPNAGPDSNEESAHDGRGDNHETGLPNHVDAMCGRTDAGRGISTRGSTVFP